mgnify:CR=1 FL=1
MEAAFVTTSDGNLLRAIRSTLSNADAALLCVAYVNEPGVHLLGKELQHLGKNARILATTAFGTTTAGALNTAHAFGVRVKILNPAASSYHPKLYLGQRSNKASAVIGSANMTGGLVNNVEVASALTGDITESALRAAVEWAEERWHDPRANPWLPCSPGERERPRFSDELLGMLQEEVDHVHVFMTLGSKPQENEVVELTPTEIYVHTRRSQEKGTGAQPIPAWMFNLAWEYLQKHGTLTNAFLLNELRVHRSSAVCAILARLPHVQSTSSPIRLEWQGDV